jgi:hypothetical protein
MVSDRFAGGAGTTFQPCSQLPFMDWLCDYPFGLTCLIARTRPNSFVRQQANVQMKVALLESA